MVEAEVSLAEYHYSSFFSVFIRRLTITYFHVQIQIDR